MLLIKPPLKLQQQRKLNKKQQKLVKKQSSIHSMVSFTRMMAPAGTRAMVFRSKESTNICKSLKNNHSILIFGCPSIYSQKYASKLSKIGHINCKTQENLKKKLEMFFYNTFVFSMNDEVLHTGYSKMANYYFIICVNKKK